MYLSCSIPELLSHPATLIIIEANMPVTDRRGKEQDCRREIMGSEPAEAHLFRYVSTTSENAMLQFRRYSSNSWLLTICIGKVLNDANTVESYKIEEKGFVVCMQNKVINREPDGYKDGSDFWIAQARTSYLLIICDTS